MPVAPIACLTDNYAYVVHADAVHADAGTREQRVAPRQAVVIDPSEAGPVVDYLQRHELRLGGLLLTHHHWDHVGGIAGLCQRFGEVPVLAHRVDGAQVRGVNRYVEDAERFAFGELEFEAMHVPGHTLGALAYRFGNALFTGDTLFIAGCGRLFEGTPADMFGSLSKLAALPEDTEIYCGHEYALRNLAFALAVEPGNTQVTDRITTLQKRRSDKLPSVPSTMLQELETNPFLRCARSDFRERARMEAGLDALGVFTRLRSRRDSFQA